MTSPTNFPVAPSASLSQANDTGSRYRAPSGGLERRGAAIGNSLAQSAAYQGSYDLAADLLDLELVRPQATTVPDSLTVHDSLSPEDALLDALLARDPESRSALRAGREREVAGFYAVLGGEL
jgi:hypothetical protein